MSDLPDQSNLSNLTTQTTRLAEAMEELNNASAKSAASADKHAAAERGVAEICQKLNEVLPGLGSTLDLMSARFHRGAEAAEAGAAANESFIASMGPIAVVLLSIQAAMQYWDMYKDKVKEAQEAQSEALQKMVDDLNAAREAQDKFFEAQHPKDDPIRKIERDFDKNVAVARAEVAGNKTISKAKENSELAKATSPQEREAIKRMYEGSDTQQDNLLAQKIADAKATEMRELNDEIAKATGQGDDLRQQILIARKAGDTGTVEKLTDEWNKVSDELKQLIEKKDSLQADIDKDRAVAAINDKADATAKAQGDDTVAQAVNAEVAKHHGTITPAQQAAIDRLGDLYNAVGGNTNLMLEALKHAADHQQTLGNEIQSIKQQLASLASQQRTG